MNMGNVVADALAVTHDFGKIRAVYLQMGPECNMNCRHCHQREEKHLRLIDRKVSDDVMRMLGNFIEYSRKDEFRGKGRPGDPLFRITFFGGEALLFWKSWAGIVERFVKEYDLLSDDVFRFTVTTNGLCVDDDFIRFANDNDVVVAFSYDAPYPFAVRGYVSDAVCNAVRKIKHYRIISCGSSYNCDVLLSRRCLKAKFPEAVSWSSRPEVLRCSDDMPADIDAYDFGKLRYAVRKVFVGAKVGDKDAVGIAKHWLDSPEKRFFHNTGGLSVCISGFRRLVVTPDGKVSFCCNSYDRDFGDIYGNTVDDVFRKAVSAWRGHADSKCRDCEVWDLCRRRCGRLLVDKDNHAYNCDRFKIPFYRIVREEAKVLDTPLTEDEKSWYREQETVMDDEVRRFLLRGEKDDGLFG